MNKPRLSCTIRTETMEALDAHCEEHDSTKSKVVDKALTRFLKENGVMK